MHHAFLATGWSASPQAFPFPRSLRAYSREVNVIRTSSSDSGSTSAENSPTSSFYSQNDDKMSPSQKLSLRQPTEIQKTDSFEDIRQQREYDDRQPIC
jgi:hypothetical protein